MQAEQNLQTIANKQPLLSNCKKTDVGEVDCSVSSDNKQAELTQGLMEVSYVKTDQLTHSANDNEPLDKVSTRCTGQWIYPKLNTAGVSADADVNNGLHALADYGYYDNKDYAELSGNVTVKQGGQLIRADKVTLDLATNTALADGQVLFTNTFNTLSATSENNNSDKQQHNKQKNKFSSAGVVGVADKVTYHTDKATAEVADIAFASVPMQAHGYAKRMTKQTESQYKLQDVTFSTCTPQVVNKASSPASAEDKSARGKIRDKKVQRKWQIDASQIDLNTDTGRAETYNTTLRIKDVPVLYLPYFNFPIDERRSSGFLLPNASLSSTTGLELSLPYYFNLAPNYDATMMTRVFTDRNPMLTGEFRYLTDGYGRGRVVASFLPKDKRYGEKNRSSLYYRHGWQSEKIPHWTADAEFNYVSDSSYNDDFDYLGSVVNELNLPRHIKSNYFNDHLNAELKFETFQSLDATNSDGLPVKDKDRPYDRLPQLSLEYRLPKVSQLAKWTDTDRDSVSALDNAELTGEHNSAYFKKRIDDNSAVEQSGFRMYNALNASYPFHRPWGSITPSVKLQHLLSSYDKDALAANHIAEEDNFQTVFVPQFSLDAEAHLIKQGAPFAIDSALGGYQILSPRVKYSYAPYKKQNDIPNFNTGIASVSYDQLYADSWFLGYDRLQDLHAITPGVNYRYVDANGLTRLDASVAEQYYLDKGLVTLDDNSGIRKQSNHLFSEDTSGIVTSISARPYDKLWLDFDGALNSDYDLSYITSQVRYQPTDSSQFSLGVVERKFDENTNQLALSALTGSAVFPIQDNWRLVSQTQYDYDKNKFLDALVGIDYEDCCLGFSVYGRHYYNDLQLNDDSNNAVMAELRLKGISDKGRLNKLLSSKIMGIDDVNNQWIGRKNKDK